MEHESFVPGMTTARMVQALRTPDAVRAALPGWQGDAGGSSGGATAAGRLRLRVGGSTITYRGTVTVSGDGPGFTVTAVGTEVRGGGGVTATAEVSVVTAVQPESGVTMVWRGVAEAEGRLSTYEPAAVESAVRRLLDRFSADVAAQALDAGGPAGDVHPTDDVDDDADDTREPAEGAGPGTVPADPDPDPADAEAEDEPEADVVDDLGEPGSAADLDEFELVEVEVEVPESAAALDDLVPPAEAAHARRTMIGRSAEEVDHAPPRGRYAPVPAPDSSSAAATLRWAAPVAAALVASAVVVGRVLRRRG